MPTYILLLEWYTVSRTLCTIRYFYWLIIIYIIMASKKREFVFSGHETFHAEQGKEPDTRMSLSLHSFWNNTDGHGAMRDLDLKSSPSVEGSDQKQVVSQLPLARPLSFVCLVLILVAWVLCMPPKRKLSLAETKAFQTEQLRLRTERRLAQLRQDQRQLEISEVLYLLSIIWVILIVAFYARLYLGPQE